MAEMLTARHGDQPGSEHVVGRGVPGVGHGWVGTGEGYTGTLPSPSQYPYFSHILALSPTHGQMKAYFMVLMRFPRKGQEWVPDMTSE